MADAIENVIRDTYLATDAAFDPTASVQRVLAPRYHQRARRRRWSIRGVSAIAVAVGVVLAVVLIASGLLPIAPGPPVADADWSATPSPASMTPRVLASAIRSCDRFATPTGRPSAPQNMRLRTPVLTDVRGKSVAVLTVTHNAVHACIVGGGQLLDQYYNGTLAAPEPNKLSSGPVGGTRGAAYSHGHEVEGLGAGWHLVGRAGSQVSAVRFTFANGVRVTATVRNGWYFAWWPWTTDPRSVQLTTTSGTTTTSAMSCRPRSLDCVFSNKVPSDH